MNSLSMLPNFLLPGFGVYVVVMYNFKQKLGFFMQSTWYTEKCLDPDLMQSDCEKPVQVSHGAGDFF